ncbi:tetratricopeptide repeat protein, partial [bacterium]|nr:tetratricopeptide repeat protein [bacterium]
LHSDVFGNLQKMNLRLIFTCRQRPPHAATCLEVGPMSAEELLQLMRLHYEAEDDGGYLPQIIEAAQYNTYVVDQAARLLRKSRGELTPEKLLAQMRSSDKENTVTGILRKLFSLSKLSEPSQSIMAQAALLPVSGMRAALFLSTHDEEQQNLIRVLECSGWLKKSTNNFISLHPLVREICLPEIKNFDFECKEFVANYSIKFLSSPSDEHVKFKAENIEIFSNAADFLEDSDGKLASIAGEVNFNGGLFHEALAYFQKCLNILQLYPQSSVVEELDIRASLADCMSRLGNFQESLYYLESSLSEAEGNIGIEEHSKLISYYKQLADIYLRIYNVEKAGKIYEILIRLLESSNRVDEFTAANIYISCAKFYIMRGQYKIAEKYNSKAVKIAVNNKDLDLLAIAAATLQNRAQCAFFTGRFDVAMKDMKTVIKLYEEKLFGKHHPITAESYGSLAFILFADDKFSEALDYLELAKKILEEFYGENHPTSGNVYFLMALVLFMLDDKIQAEEWLDKAISIYKEVFGEQDIQTKTILFYKKLFNGTPQTFGHLELDYLELSKKISNNFFR